MGQHSSQCYAGPLGTQCRKCGKRESTLDFDFLENEHDVTGVTENRTLSRESHMSSTQLKDPSIYDPEMEAPVDPAEIEQLEQLTGMGFTEEQAITALREAGGDGEVALEKLLAMQ